MIHARLGYLTSLIPLKSELGYFKPHTVDVNGKVKFKPGEIDFIFKCGKRLVPIEVKHTSNHSNINTTLLEEFVTRRKCPFGLVLYGGVPFPLAPLAGLRGVKSRKRDAS